MLDARRLQIRTLTAAMGLLEKHPLAAKLFLRPLANAPFLSDKMMVLPRAYMGATAFEIHDVDQEAGRIGIGGVEEIMAGAKIVHLLHTTLAEQLGEKKKNQSLYEMGKALCCWEVSEALKHGRWAPAALVPLIFGGHILDEVQSDPLVARFFERVLNMMSRLITDEGGWGHLEFDVTSTPLKVTLTNSQEARWLGPSRSPVCYFYAGIVAGYGSTLSREELVSREVACKAMGAEKCVFELHR